MRNRIWTKTPWILGLALIVAWVAYGFVPRAIEVEVGIVQRKRLEVTVNDEGEMRVRERYVVSVPVAGQMQRLELHAGDPVKEGETVLLRLTASPPSLLDKRTVAELHAREGAAKSSVDRSEAMIQSAKESLNLAKHEFERLVPLQGSKMLSQAEYDAAEHQLEMARANYRASLFAKQVASFELETTRALLGMNEVEDTNPIAEIKLVSPIDGRVLNVLREDAGTIAAGTGVMTIGDPNDLEVQVEVLSQDAIRIRPGAKMHVERWGGQKTLSGVVRLVEPYAFLKISALGVEEKRVRVIGDLIGDSADRQSIGDGYRIEARIIVDETSSDALLIPAGALFRDQAAWKVFRIEQGSAHLCSVEIGNTNGFETEIRSGLDADDQIILYPTDKIRDGAYVTTIRKTMRR